MLSTHMHCYVPSSSPDVKLEARIYLPSWPEKHSSSVKPLSPQIAEEKLKQWYGSTSGTGSDGEVQRQRKVIRMVLGVHPWSRLGGNMLDPVLTHSLVPAALSHSRIGVKTINMRGVGLSGGWQAWLGSDGAGKDVIAVEEWMGRILGVKEVWRLGYSWGTMSVLSSAPSPPLRLKGIFLVSPPLSIFKLTAFVSSSLLPAALQTVLDDPETLNTALADRIRIWMIHGTEDEFTSNSVYHTFSEKFEGRGLHVVEIPSGGHFYRSQEEHDLLTKTIEEWLE
ncbi:hypothetical protein M231_06018 [Tremella mesenterica]|uniref:AB hydrolase-1 domain-containing protein n=1 Tax=Tremella mesenterica TaxID=5217 RepID=A0A4Q1BGK9_TREME|nr:hypothetical protein M231_06018 [Tremella mesenterica]